MTMISRYSAEVFGYVPKDVKRRMAVIRQHDRMWSESRMIKEALLRFLPELERMIPVHDKPSRKKEDAA